MDYKTNYEAEVYPNFSVLTVPKCVINYKQRRKLIYFFYKLHWEFNNVI